MDQAPWSRDHIASKFLRSMILALGVWEKEETSEALTAAGFSAAGIVKIAGNGGGAHALGAVAEFFPLLLTQHVMDEIVMAASRSRGAAAYVRQRAEACRVKQEQVGVGSIQKDLPDGLVERKLDQAQTAFIPELAHCDLSTGQAVWSLELDENRAVIVRHPMEPIPANNDRFPLPDLADPLHRVCARHAGNDGKCHRNVHVDEH